MTGAPALALCACLALAGLAPAQDAPRVPALKLTAPESVTAGGAFFEVLAGASGPVAWEVTGAGRWKAFGASVVISPPAGGGTVHVTCAVGAGEGKPPLLVSADVQVTGPQPAPAPATPKAEQPPAPKAPVKLYAYVVADPTAAAPANAPGFRAAAAALVDEVRVLRPGGTAVDALKLAGPLADVGGPPATIVVGEDGKVYAAERLAPTEAGLLETLKKAKEAAR